MALKLNTVVSFEQHDEHGPSYLTIGFVWAKSTDPAKPVCVRLALSAPRQDPKIISVPREALRMVPMGKDVVSCFTAICLDSNLRALAAASGRIDLAEVVEVVRAACSYCTERCASGGKALDAATSSVLTRLLEADSSDSAASSRKRPRREVERKGPVQVRLRLGRPLETGEQRDDPDSPVLAQKLPWPSQEVAMSALSGIEVSETSDTEVEDDDNGSSVSCDQLEPNCDASRSSLPPLRRQVSYRSLQAAIGLQALRKSERAMRATLPVLDIVRSQSCP